MTRPEVSFFALKTHLELMTFAPRGGSFRRQVLAAFSVAISSSMARSHCAHSRWQQASAKVLRPGCHDRVFGLTFSLPDCWLLPFFINDLISSPLPIVVTRYFLTLPAPSPSFLPLLSPSGTFYSRSWCVSLPSGSFCMLPMCSG
jgi:hypothetical protein